MKDEILKAAAERFGRYGFQKTTLEDIASDLHKVKSSVYYYYDNKEDLFKAVIEYELENFAVALGNILEKVKTPREKLRIFIVSHLNIFEKLTKGYSVIGDIYFSKYDIVQKLRSHYDEREIALIENIISEGNSKKEFFVKNKKNTATVILTAIKGAEQEFLMTKTAKNMKAVSETMAMILVNGISKEK